MALNNCSMSSNSFDENLGSNLSGRSANDRTLLITPDEGYVLDKDKFTIPSSLPSGVDSITLSNTGFPGEPENNVSVVVAISSSYSASPSNNVISLGITGSADLYVKPPEGSDNKYANAYVWLSFIDKHSSTSRTLVSGVTAEGDNLQSLKASLAIQSGVSTKLASYRISADTGKRFLHPPKLALINSSADADKYVALSLDVTSVSKDVNNNIVSYDYDLNYISSFDIYKNDLLKYEISIEAFQKPTITNEIKRVDFGSKDVDKNGETRRIRVFGDVGARFSISAKETGQSDFFPETSFVIESIGKYGGTNKGVNYKSINIDIPAKSTATTYEIKITAGDETKLNSSSIGSSPKTYTVNQFPNPTLTFSATGPGGANYSNPASITKVGRPNRTSVELAYLKTLKTTFDINYSITTTSSSISIDKTPELKVFERSGEVRSNDLDRIYMSNTAGLTTGMRVIEHSNDTTVTARNITGITANQYVDVSTNLNAGNKKDFTFLKSDWKVEENVVPFLNGGTRVSLVNASATASGQTATIKGTLIIKRFGNASKTLDLGLSNILTES